MNGSGIYSITHIESGRVYVGSSKCIADRWRQHRRALRAGKHHSSYLQRAWSKYGEDAFRFEVLEACDLDVLIQREAHWMEVMRSRNKRRGFNMNEAGPTRLGARVSPEIREKMKAAKAVVSEETRARLRAAWKRNPGTRHTEESRKKLSEANSKPRRPRSEETKEKLRLANIGKKRTPEVVEKYASKLRGHKQDPDFVRRRAEKLVGQKRSEESREKMRQSALRRYARERAEKLNAIGTTA